MNSNQIEAFPCTLKHIRNIYEIQKAVVISGGYYYSKILENNLILPICQQFELFPCVVTLKLAQLVQVYISGVYVTDSNHKRSLRNGVSSRLHQFIKVKPTPQNCLNWRIIFVN